MRSEDIVVGLVVLSGGELVGKTRLQKEVYLLDCCGANFGLQFTYHYYGPYSFELAMGSESARAERLIEIEERLGRYDVPYSIFKTDDETPCPPKLGDLDAAAARDLLTKMKDASDVILELAATIVFLEREWDYYRKGEVSAVEETKARKSLKATDKAIAKALELLRLLDVRGGFATCES